MPLFALLLALPAHAQAPAAQSDAAAQQAPAAATLAGKVDAADGTVRILDRERKPRTPKSGDPVYEGESIVTGPDGELQVQMEDGGLIAVRPSTKMRIAQFRAEGDDEDRLTFGLLEGSFRSVTGWIAKLRGNRYQVRTPTATIGVRGTDHEPMHVLEGSSLGEPGTYEKVNQGGTYLQTKQGRVEVAPGKAAFAGFKPGERPRLLERVPALFRAGRHDERMTKRYHEIQQRLPQQREERRKGIEERRHGKAEQQRHGREGGDAQAPHAVPKGGEAQKDKAHKDKVQKDKAQKDKPKKDQAPKEQEAPKQHKSQRESKGRD